MKMKHIAWIALAIMLAFASLALPCKVAAEDPPSFEYVDAIGTHFELPEVNVFVTTDVVVHVYLRACSSELIGYYIENASDAGSTQLTLGYLKPFTTYYMYEDSYVNEKAFTTDDLGSYTYNQDLSKLHFVFIQPAPSTLYISKSTTLQSDIYNDVAIIANDIVLDLNGHSIIGSGWMGWMGIDVVMRRNVTIKDGSVRNHVIGIYLGDSRNIVVRNVTMSSNWLSDLEMSGAWNSLFTENTFTSETGLECGWGSSGNKIYHNNFMGYNWWYNYGYTNGWDNGYPSGGNYWSSYTGSDLYNGLNQNIPGSDGIGDSPRVVGGSDVDHYPLMNPWTPPVKTVVKISGTDTPVAVETNTALGQISANKNNLKFTASGSIGSEGYVNLILPTSAVTTGIQVYVDNKKLPSPFPVVNTNGTHYFVYFEFMLSTHVVTVQFAPSINAIVDIDPDALNLKNKGQWITGYIELAEEYDVNDIDVSTLILNDTVSAALSPTIVGDYDNDGVPDLMIKFNRTEVSQYICDVQKIRFGSVTLQIRGELHDGSSIEGSDKIKVRMPGDVDCNGAVDGKDVCYESKYFGTRAYDFRCDLNEDGAIDGRDLTLVCMNFGKVYK